MRDGRDRDEAEDRRAPKEGEEVRDWGGDVFIVFIVFIVLVMDRIWRKELRRLMVK